MIRKLPKKITRRGFVAGAAVSAATTAAVALTGCNSGGSKSQELVEGVLQQFPDATVEYLRVEPSQVLPYTGMTNAESIDYLQETRNFDLPLGSLVFQSSDTHALVLAPGASSKALIRLGTVHFDEGQFVPVLGQARGASEDYVIYDARASDSSIIWVECNMVQGTWRVYATSLKDGTATEGDLQEAALIDEGDVTHSPPQLAVSGNKVYWTVMPDPNGPASSEDSYLKTAEFASGGAAKKAEARTIYTSHGRLIANPTISGDVLTIVPRVDTDSVYYQLTALDVKTDAVLNAAILPPSLRVSDAVWLENGFAFGIEGNYDYAEGLSFFGTYQQLGDGQYLYVNKVPSSSPVLMSGLTYVKSTKNVIGLDPKTGTAVIVDTPQECVSYGDILAGTGLQERLVLYTTVTARTGRQAGICRVRVYDHL